MTQADESIAARDWERAILLLQAAERKADLRREIDKVNQARYNLSFCYYMNKQYYESNVLAEHLARRYPQGWALAQGGRRLACRRWPRLTTLTPRSTGQPTWSG